MFELARENKCWWPVDLPTTDDQGEVVNHRVRVLYRLLTRKQLARDRNTLATDMLKASGRVDAEGEGDRRNVGQVLEDLAARDEGREQRLREHVCDIRDIVDQDGNAVPFGPEVLAALMEREAWFEALHEGLYRASAGARPKNSSPGPGGQPAPAQSATATGSGTSTGGTPT